MTQETIERLDTIIREAARDLFLAYAVALDERIPDTPPSDDRYASTIGFTSKTCKGALTVTMCRALVEKSLPPELLHDGNDGLLIDWAGELSNQFLGRIKRKLQARGIEIFLSTPVVFRGRNLHFFPQQADLSRSFGFGHGDSHIEALFQAHFSPGYTMVLPDCEQFQSLAEGEVALF